MANKFENFKKRQTYPISLPMINENGCYEMRLESIGGLGANLCGKLLGELGAAYLGLGAAAFSSYGSKSEVRLLNPMFAGVHLSVIFCITVLSNVPIFWCYSTTPCQKLFLSLQV